MSQIIKQNINRK